MKGVGAVRPIVTVVTADNSGFWAEKALEMSKNTLETYVKEFCPRTENVDISAQQEAIDVPKNAFQETENPMLNSKQNRKNIIMELDAAVLEKLEKLKGEGSWNELFEQLLNEREEMLEQSKPEIKKTDSRHIPAAIKRHVIKRTNGQCAYPRCKKKVAILHHTDRFALKKEHNSDTIKPMCKPHERIAHHGLIENEQGPSENWRVKALADKPSYTFKIDQMVMKYRMAGVV